MFLQHVCTARERALGVGPRVGAAFVDTADQVLLSVVQILAGGMARRQANKDTRRRLWRLARMQSALRRDQGQRADSG